MEVILCLFNEYSFNGCECVSGYAQIAIEESETTIGDDEDHFNVNGCVNCYFYIMRLINWLFAFKSLTIVGHFNSK